MSKRSDRRQAKREAALQYNPQIDALTSILGGLTADKKASVRQARTGARITARSAKNALPEARKIYKDALAGNTPGQKLIASEAAKLDSSSPFASAIAIETGGATTRMQAAKARTLSELVGRRVDAAAGGQQEVRSIRQGYQADKAKTLDQLLGVSKQKGLYASTRYGDLRKDAAGRAVTKRGQTLSHKDRVASQKAAKEKAANDLSIKRGVDPVTGALLKKPADAKKPPTPAEKRARNNDINKSSSQISKAIAQANQLKKGGRDRHEAAGILQLGRPTQTVDKGGQKIKIPAIDSFDQVIASVALDMAYDGHVSAKNQKILRKRYPGVLRSLGLPLKPKPAPTAESFVGAKAHT